MGRFDSWITTGLLLAYLACGQAALIEDEDVASAWLVDYNEQAETYYYASVLASWNYNTNITDYNQDLSVQAGVQKSLFQKEAGLNASLFDWEKFENASLKREFSKIAVIGTAKLEEDEIEKVDTLRAEMQRTYSVGEVYYNETHSLNLDPDLTRLMATSHDYEELKWAWQGWRDVTGKKMKDKYEEFVALQNKAAELNGFDDNGAYWRSWYEDDQFEKEVLALWDVVEPLYQHLHYYVKNKLQQVYADHPFPTTGHIPAHILGNMWAQSWTNIDTLVQPFPNSSALDVTHALVEQGYDAEQLFELAESFFDSLGLEKMPDEFWSHSMIEKPADRDVVCHASAWDFYNRKDFRIKQCTDITMDWLITTHHEMGHIQYYLQYKNQPVNFRRGANPGFHEAVGDVMSLSVSTPEHLKEIGLLDQVEQDEEADLNFLMQMALEKVAFLPFGLLIDQWRWDVFKGTTVKDNYNERWWEYRCKYQGVSPPVERSEEDFDPGAKYHIPANTPYIRYFVSFIIQFQIHKGLCEAANNNRSLHRCDIYNSQEAGKMLGDMLKLGSSVEWPQALKQVTGSEKMDASALMEYFAPLYDWLKEQNGDADVGWTKACPEGSFDHGSAPPSLALTPLLLLLAIITSIRQLF